MVTVKEKPRNFHVAKSSVFVRLFMIAIKNHKWRWKYKRTVKIVVVKHFQKRQLRGTKEWQGQGHIFFYNCFFYIILRYIVYRVPR